MKQGITLIFVFFVVLALRGQESRPRNLPVFDSQPAHLGYSVGINFMNFLHDGGDGVTIRQNPGINLNLITSVRLSRYLYFRALPGIMFGQRDVGIKTVAGEWDAKIESVYIDLPLLVKYRSERVNNYAPYLIAGVNPRFDLIGGEIIDWKPAHKLVQTFDVFPELGFGIDFYLAKVKLATELKFSVGMLNIFLPADDELEYALYNNAFNRISSNMVILSFHIE